MLKQNCLTIGGSHPTSEAGIQADLNCGYFWGTYNASIISTVTAQNKHKFNQKLPIPNDLFEKQIITSLEVLPKPYVKIGMISQKDHYSIIKSYQSRFSYILYDPILSTTTNETIINTTKEMLSFISSCCSFITPNFEEFKTIANCSLNSESFIIQTLKKFSNQYSCSIFLKGGHSKNSATDYLINKEQQIYRLSLPVINNIKTSHGTGCKIAMSIISNLAKGENELNSVINAKAYVYKSLNNPIKIHHGWMMDNIKSIDNIKEKIIINQI